MSKRFGPVDEGNAGESPGGAEDRAVITASGPLSEDLALSLLASRELAPAALEALAKNGHAMKYRRVQMALVIHPKTPRYIALPFIRRLHTFELLRIARLPSVAADLKMVAEETIIARAEGISAGERLSLARQGTTHIAAALLADPEARVTTAALNNSRLTEAAVIRAVSREDAPEHLIQAVCTHPKWSLGRDLQLALLRSEFTPLAKAILFLRAASDRDVRDVLRVSRLPENIKTYLEQMLTKRASSRDAQQS